MRFLGVFAALAFMLTPALPQKPATPDGHGQDEPTIKVDVEVVNLLCSVRRDKGGLVNDLTAADFEIYEDGKKQEIRYFSRETDLPLTIGLLVDVSRSQESLIEIQKQAASQFFREVLRKKDLAFLISFGSEVELLQDLTSSPGLLSMGLDKLRLSTSVSGIGPGPVPTMDKPRGTVLFDAVYLSSDEMLKEQVGRKAMVLITDGVDVGSRLKRQDAIEAAQKADAIIYSVYYHDSRAYGYYPPPGDGDLNRMSRETGGRLFRVSKKNTLSSIFDQIQEEMRSQYAIGYTPSNPVKDGKFRRIEIKTKQKGLKVQSRNGYYAEP